MPPLVLNAHAKLNLCLAVGPPQPPRGYHPIRSWFVPIDLHDTVAIERLTDGSPSVHSVAFAPDAPRPSPVDWPIEKDLAVRAHRLLERHIGRELPAGISIAKRIPVGGGLGGGSSDAAAAMMGLDRLFQLGLGASTLRELSAQLGADVAFFIDDVGLGGPPRPAIVSGFGETIERVGTIAGLEVMLIFPPFGCPTAAVYAEFDRQFAAGRLHGTAMDRVDELARSTLRSGRLDTSALFNDLTQPACAVHPELAVLLGRLNAVATAHQPPAGVHMTGSGSTLFCTLEPSRRDRGEAEPLIEALRDASSDGRCGAVLQTRIV